MMYSGVPAYSDQFNFSREITMECWLLSISPYFFIKQNRQVQKRLWFDYIKKLTFQNLKDFKKHKFHIYFGSTSHGQQDTPACSRPPNSGRGQSNLRLEKCLL